MIPLAGAAALLLAFGGGAASPGTIVFAADRAPQVAGDVYRADWNGDVVDLTHSAWRETQPLVSPNGQRVAFFSNRDGISVWTIGVNGKGLTRLQVAGLSEEFQPAMAWSPDSRELAIETEHVRTATLFIAGPGMTPRVLGHPVDFGVVSWSPDGKLVTVDSDGSLDAFTPSGREAWSVPSGPISNGFFGWSAGGLYAGGPYDGRAHVVDENGKARFSFAAESAAWSPNGSELASMNRRQLAIHTSGGRLVVRTTLPVFPGWDWRWASDTKLVIRNDVTFVGGYSVDARTGKVSPFDYDAYGLNTAGSTTSWTIRDGTHVYTHVIGCTEDGGWEAAVTSLQAVPHSRSVVYQSDCEEPYDNLYSIHGDGTGLTRITTDEAQETSPQLSPDGTRIAYDWATATGLSCKGCPTSVRTIGLDGSAPATLTDPTDCTFDTSPSWSPDGTQILFSHSACDTAPDLMTVPAAGGAPKDLHLPGWSAAWGPNRLGYSDGMTDPTSVWTALPNGSGRQQIGTGEAQTLDWSSDGRLVYVVGTTAFVGGTKVRLPFQQVRSIAWSPDGTQFVLAAEPKGGATFDVYVVNADGSDPVRLTHDLDVSSADWR